MLAKRPQAPCQHAGCCHSHQPSKPNQTAPQSSPDKPRNPDPTNCPCRENQQPSVAGTALETDMGKNLQPVFQGMVEDLTLPQMASMLSAREVAQVSQESMTFPFMNAQDILRALQTFRC